jgi:hypothetical protein
MLVTQHINNCTGGKSFREIEKVPYFFIAITAGSLHQLWLVFVRSQVSSI